MVGWLVCWFVGLLVGWFVSLLVCWFVGLMVCWFVGLLVGWLDGTAELRHVELGTECLGELLVSCFDPNRYLFGDGQPPYWRGVLKAFWVFTVVLGF